MSRRCLWIVVGISLLTFSLSNVPLVSAATTSTKLGIYVVDTANQNEVNGIIAACPPILKVQDPQRVDFMRQAMKTYKKKCSGGIVIMRVYVDASALSYHVSDDPVAKANDFWDNGDPNANRLLPAITKLRNMQDPDGGNYFQYVDYVSGPNEYDNTPDIKTAGAPQWYGQFWTQLARTMGANGVKPVLGEIPEGNIDTNNLDGELKPLMTAFTAIANAGGAWSYHAYSYSPTLNDALNGADTQHALRYRLFYEYLQQNKGVGDRIPPFLLTEVGAEHLVTPRDHADAYEAWIAWFDKEIQKDSYVIGGTIYQIGSLDAQWSNRDIAPIANWLISYYGGTATIPPGGSNPSVPPETNPPQHEPCPGHSWVGSIFGGATSWVNGLLNGNVSEEVKLASDITLPPRSDGDCPQATTRIGAAGTGEKVLAATSNSYNDVGLAAHSYGELAAQTGTLTIEEDKKTWWDSIIHWDIGDAAKDGQTFAAVKHDSNLPPKDSTTGSNGNDGSTNPGGGDTNPGGGTIPPGNGTEPAFNGWTASLLVGRIKEQCNQFPTADGWTVVRRGNYGCLDGLAANYTPPAKDAGISILKTSAASYVYLQCVGFVQGAVEITTNSLLDNGGNAIDFASYVPTGWVYVPLDGINQARLKLTDPQSKLEIKAGDLLIFGAGFYGHIANVATVVDSSNFTYTIAEANYGASGKVELRTIDIFTEINNFDKLIGFLRKT